MAVNRVAARLGRGFTLLELLVVLLIIGLVTGLVSALVLPDERALLRVEADRLARLLELGAEEARLGGNAIAWTADRSGYHFWQADGDAGWTPVTDRDLFRARALPAGIAITGLRIENATVGGPIRLQFSADDVPFAYSIGMASGRGRLTIESSPIGDITVVGEAGGRDGAPPRP